MIQHPVISILFVADDDDPNISSLLSYLAAIPHIRPVKQPQLLEDISTYDVVVTFPSKHSASVVDKLTAYVRSGGGWLTLVHLTENALPEIFGVQPEPAGPEAELRVLFENQNHPLDMSRIP